MVLAVTCLALATVTSAMASLNVAIPDIARETHAKQSQLAWIIDAYSLFFASLLLLAGTLGDRYGRKKALGGGLALFGAASLAATFTTEPSMLILLRAVMGVAAAFVMPATLSTITSTFPQSQRARAVSVWAAVAGGSAVLGLLASGVVLEAWSWQSVFWLNVVLAAAALIGTVFRVPESAQPARHRIDSGGALLTVAGLGVLVFSIIEAPDYGWGSFRTVAGIAVGLAVLAGFVVWELKQAHPLLDPRLFRRVHLSAGTLSVTLQFFAFYGFVFVMMQYLQMVRRDSALVAAVSVLPMAAFMIPAARLSPRFTARMGTRGPWTFGLLMIAAGLVVLAQIDRSSSYGWVLAGLLPLGIGMGMAMTPATTSITDVLPPALQNVGSALNDLSRELGGALGIAVVGSVLDAVYKADLDVAGLPSPVAEVARSSIAAAAGVGDPALTERAQDAFVSGLQSAFVTGAAASALGAIAVFILLGRRAGREDERPAGSVPS
ncbi:MFS transporter [Streptomyces sp. NPDC090303]|uniref:MFS transporter n=1 Tax=Streptomyces sp. NPDC090303 TaxID=3365960 RepID=UPI00381C316F